MILADKLRELVEEECKKDTNPFSYVAFIHIRETVKHAKKLAQRLGADEDVCEKAAWLHDWGSITGRYEDHHIVGAVEAERILKGFNYPQDKIEKVKYCILTHRGSQYFERKTIEAEILASADAMSHFTTIDTLFNMVYSTKRMSYEDGKEFVRKKLQRDWDKLMPDGRDLVKKYYDVLMEILNDT